MTSLRNASAFCDLLNTALEHGSDGIEYEGLFVGLARFEAADVLLVPLVSGEDFWEGKMTVEHAKVLFRVRVELVHGS